MTVWMNHEVGWDLSWDKTYVGEKLVPVIVGDSQLIPFHGDI